ncbi:MAG: thiamine phosphate synthase [Rhodothermia bacterium]|nr:thiamine phosphate synthase [Rhodothermia bacterium]
MQIGRLHIITDFWFQQRYSHAELASMAISGGADTIQFRQKHGSTRHLLEEAQKTADLCREAGIPLIVNDRIDVALAIEANGIHLGQEDFPLAVARRLLGKEVIIGATATTLGQARKAQDEGASYVGFGPVYATSSKANPAAVKGIDILSQVCHGVDIPVIAIAGIKTDRVSEVMSAGAHGVAVMTAVSLADDPVSAVRDLAERLRES